jgi:hypothetical protein
LTDITSGCLSLQIAAPPVDGEANAAILSFFADLLKIKKADIELRVSVWTSGLFFLNYGHLNHDFLNYGIPGLLYFWNTTF